MPSIILKNYAEPKALSNENKLTPFSFQEWLIRNIGIIPDQAEKQYNDYLVIFYDNKKKSIQNSNDGIKEDYISLLKRLQIIFKDDEEFNRLANINFDDITELKLTIPYFARKLKEIALYYISKREQLKKTKLKYNLIGSNEAVEKILYEYLLTAFTKKNNFIPVQDKNLFNNIAALSSVSDSFSIKVQELYDTSNYFDVDKNKSTTGYYPLSTNNPLLFVLEDYIFNFYNAFNIDSVPLADISNPLSRFVLCESGNILNEQILAQLGTKYIANNIYYMSGGFYDFKNIDVDLPLSRGDNFFYWFSGEYVREIPEGVFVDTAISSINWDLATGSPKLSSSDIVFISKGNKVIEGAWLKDTAQITVMDTMSAIIRNGKIFKFPYPNFGLSAENLNWTGPKIEDIKEFNKEFFPSEESFILTQKNVQDLYWSSYNSISAVESIYLNDSHLYESGAYASNNFETADKILIRRKTGSDNIHDTAPNQIFNGDFDAAWLYKFPQTELAIAPAINNIYFPLTSYKTIDQLFMRYTTGDPIALSSINVGSSFAGAVAGNLIDEADILIKLNSACGGEKEAAWLKGIPLSAFTKSKIDSCNCNDDYIKYYTNWVFKNGVIQPSLSFKATPGQFIRFVWTGPNTSLNDIAGFDGFVHDSSCPYYQDRDFISLLDNNFLDLNKKEQFEKWKKCTCQAVNYSPIGHKGDIVTQYKVTPDMILKDTEFPNFSFNSWRGRDGRTFEASYDAAWFKLDDSLEPDLGWGKGVWKVTHELEQNKSTDFVLETAQTYIFYRSDLNRCNFGLPYFIINHGYCNCIVDECKNISCIPVWTKAKYDDDSKKWVDAGTITDMVLTSDTFFTYKHKTAFDFSKSILTYDGVVLYPSVGEYITLSSVDVKIDSRESLISVPSINFLIKIPLINNTPYWGIATFKENDNTKQKAKMYGVADFRQEREYLQIKQPTISDIMLNNNDVIEYKTSSCNDCFIWKELLKFDVREPHRGWNKILIDNNVKSELYNYIHDLRCNPCNIDKIACIEDNCNTVCYPIKTSITASDIPSDMIFNTELSGIPVFVDYFARNPFTLHFTMHDMTNGVPPSGGVWVPPMSTIFAKAELPWENIINDFYPVVAAEQNNSLSSADMLGLFKPNNLFNGKYELRKAIFDIHYLERNAQSHDLIRAQTYADGDDYVKEADSSWMKWKGNNKFSGNIKIAGHQTYYPYTTNYELYKNNNLGLYDISDNKFSPWDKNDKWINELAFPANFRGIHPINCGDNAWYNNQTYLSGNVIQWQTDIFGNQYFLMNGSATRLDKTNEYSTIYIKDMNGTVNLATTVLSSIFMKYKNIIFLN